MMTGTADSKPTRYRRLLRARLSRAVRWWQLPPLPRCFDRSSANGAQEPPHLAPPAGWTKSRIAAANNSRARAELEISLVRWLHHAIRLNVKRGRLFEIDRVLSQGEADCLGYAQLFKELGRTLGLDAGIVEVVVDNAGRLVPHVANIVRLSDGRRRFVDLWYGSTNIRHCRFGLMVRIAGRWRVLDADWRELRHLADVKGLPPRSIDAIASYMIGNRHLQRGLRLSDDSEIREAVRSYTDAIARYPENARLYFNRAVAYENLRDRAAAEGDYAVALQDEAGLVRVQCRQHEEVVRLVALDHMELSQRDQEMYLMQKGFLTGKDVPPERVAARYQMSADEVTRIISRIESRLPAMA